MSLIRLQEPNHLVAFLRELRNARGWTQAELAGRLGVVQSRIAEIEKHPERVSVAQLLAVLTVLGGSLHGMMPQLIRPQGLAEPKIASKGAVRGARGIASPRPPSRASDAPASMPQQVGEPNAQYEPNPVASGESFESDQPKGEW